MSTHPSSHSLKMSARLGESRLGTGMKINWTKVCTVWDWDHVKSDGQFLQMSKTSHAKWATFDGKMEPATPERKTMIMVHKWIYSISRPKISCTIVKYLNFRFSRLNWLCVLYRLTWFFEESTICKLLTVWHCCKLSRIIVSWDWETWSAEIKKLSSKQ